MSIRQKAKLRFFSSFEEAEAADHAEMAALNPVRHLENATLLIMSLYKEEIKKPMSLKLYFKRQNEE